MEAIVIVLLFVMGGSTIYMAFTFLMPNEEREDKDRRIEQLELEVALLRTINADLNRRLFNAQYKSSQQRSSTTRSPPGSQTWCDVLGVRATHSLTLEECRRAYYRMAKIYHPDNKQTGNTAKMQRINKAWAMAQEHFMRRAV